MPRNELLYDEAQQQADDVLAAAEAILDDALLTVEVDPTQPAVADKPESTTERTDHGQGASAAELDAARKTCPYLGMLAMQSPEKFEKLKELASQAQQQNSDHTAQKDHTSKAEKLAHIEKKVSEAVTTAEKLVQEKPMQPLTPLVAETAHINAAGAAEIAASNAASRTAEQKEVMQLDNDAKQRETALLTTEDALRFEAELLVAAPEDISARTREVDSPEPITDHLPEAATPAAVVELLDTADVVAENTVELPFLVEPQAPELGLVTEDESEIVGGPPRFDVESLLLSDEPDDELLTLYARPHETLGDKFGDDIVAQAIDSEAANTFTGPETTVDSFVEIAEAGEAIPTMEIVAADMRDDRQETVALFAKEQFVESLAELKPVEGAVELPALSAAKTSEVISLAHEISRSLQAEATVEKPLELPESVTKRLYKLLDIMGYEQPEKVLQLFISQHGVQFLAEGIASLADLRDRDYRQEIAPAFMAYGFLFGGTSNPVHGGIGRLLLRLFSHPSVQQQSVA